MAPAALFVCSPDEPPYTVRNGGRQFRLPALRPRQSSPSVGQLGQERQEDRTDSARPPATGSRVHRARRRVALPFGGSVTDDAESTARWNAERAKTLKLIEVRGPLPEEIECPDTKETFRTDEKGGTVPKQVDFQCKESTCGLSQDVLESIKKTEKPGPLAAYTVQGYCPECNEARPSLRRPILRFARIAQCYDAAHREWENARIRDLTEFWPRRNSVRFHDAT